MPDQELDDNGNPIAAPDVELDESGNPVSAGMSPWAKFGAMATGAAGLVAGGYYAYKHPDSIPGKIAKYGNAARLQLMLSGYALPKSLVNNIGATAVRAGEEGSWAPLKKLFSLETAKDVGRAYRDEASVGPVGAGTLPNKGTNIPWLPTPGRIMGAFDTATQKANMRAGATADEAAHMLFQTPLEKNFGKPVTQALSSPAVQYAVPFRRTPFNQALQYAQSVSPESLASHPIMSAGAVAAGATHGALTKDDQFPTSIPLAVAGASKYGGLYGVGALVGRYANGGKGGAGVAGSMLPMSEYGLERSITDPLGMVTNPPLGKVVKKVSPLLSLFHPSQDIELDDNGNEIR